MNRHNDLNTKSEYGISPGPPKKINVHDTKSLDYEPSPIEPITNKQVGLQIDSQMTINKYAAAAPSNGKITHDQRIDLTSQGSHVYSKYEELTN